MFILIGMRKFITVMIVVAIAVIFRINDLFSGMETVDLIKTVVVAFIGANVSNKILDVVAEKFGVTIKNKDKV